MKKICIVITSLANGGTERFGGTLSHMLNDLGYDVHILITKKAVEYAFCGELYSLQQEAGTNQTILYKLKLLKDYFKRHKFDIIIDNRARPRFFKELLVYGVFYRFSRVLSMVHNYNIRNYFPSNKVLSRLVYGRQAEFIAVSKKIKERIKTDYGFSKVRSVYNPIDIKSLNTKADVKVDPWKFKYILYFGRLEENAKNFNLLIKSYTSSNLSQHEVKLVIMGKGEDFGYVNQLIQNQDLGDAILLKDYVPHPFPYVKDAIFTVLSSRFEGFPMSIIESLALGTPVVSVDCDSGPSEIITNKSNGLLVQNYDHHRLASAFNQMISDTHLYETCKLNAMESVRHLDVSEITKQWKNIIEHD